MKVPSKLPNTGTTIFTTMARMANECQALNLSQGVPDFDPPAALVQAVREHFSGPANQYAPMPGAPALLEAIAGNLHQRFGLALDPQNEITVTPGATEALFCAINALVDRDDEVIVFDPAYDSYEPAVTLAGGVVRHVPLAAPHFAVDWDQVRQSINPQTRMIIINSPHNPTGTLLSQNDLDQLAELTRDSRILVLSDEVYEHMVYDGKTHLSLLTHAELRERGLAVSSFGKTFHATGWKVGYLVAPPALTAEFRKVHQFCQFSVINPVQLGLAQFLREHPEHLTELPAFFQARRDRLASLLSEGPLRLIPSGGTYFQMVDYRHLSKMPDVELAEHLTRVAGVATIPISVFYAPESRQHGLRLCFAKDDATLAEAAQRLNRIEQYLPDAA
ncbi:MAG: methionine aminotransferase [Pseudomonadota bacterium]